MPDIAALKNERLDLIRQSTLHNEIEDATVYNEAGGITKHRELLTKVQGLTERIEAAEQTVALTAESMAETNIEEGNIADTTSVDEATNTMHMIADDFAALMLDGGNARLSDRGRRHYSRMANVASDNPLVVPAYGQPLAIGDLNTVSDIAATANSSGVAIPTEVSTMIVRTMKDYSAFMKVARVQTVATGRGELFPIMDDTAAMGEALDGTGTAAATQDIQIGGRAINFDLFSSKQLKINKTWLQDIATTDFLGIAIRSLARRLARYIGSVQTLKTADVKNRGLYDDAPLGITLKSGKATSFDMDDLRMLWSSVDPAYHMNATVPMTEETSSGQNDGMESPGSPAFMVNFDTLGQLVSLKDGENRPYLLPDYRNPGALSYLGVPFVLNQFMESPVANLRPVAFGDFSNFHILNASTFELARLESDDNTVRYQLGLVAFMRCGYRLVDGGDSIKLMKMAAS